ncbi:fimbrial biogenesis chaperone [Marinivivus vitaminiproducens]|uniref:fimbrial biogenesis chaperone n=1 Tax=Marinivivus vitaminiproducens TaxID=3035935 RepID=UPI0027A5B366|nr:molecular chaperone [Geminicoccaceae bacterium SCSIO 64248]
MTRAGLGRGRLALAALVLLLPAAGHAGALSILPSRLSVQPDGRPGTLRLENLSDQPSLVQVEAFAWSDSDQPDALTATKDLIALPAVFALPGGAEQIIRVAFRRPATLAQETSYRVIITEVPQEANRVPGGVNLAVRMSLPVFVTPPGAAPSTAWRLERDGSSGVRLVAQNGGTAHVRMTDLVVVDDAGRPVFERKQPAYVLAGEEQSWRIALDRLKGARNLRVRAESNVGALDVAVAAAGS